MRNGDATSGSSHSVRIRWANAFVSFAAVLFFAAHPASGREVTVTPAVKALYDKAYATQLKGDFAQAAVLFRRVITLNPDYVEAHEGYIFSTEQADATGFSVLENENSTLADRTKADRQIEEAQKRARVMLLRQYENWASKHPDKAVYQCGLGFLYEDVDWAQSEAHYRKAVAIDSHFSRAYYWLSLIAEIKGDNKSSAAFMQRASDLSPDDPEYLAGYADALRRVDRAKSQRVSETVIARFPRSDQASATLSELADDADTLQEHIAILERVKRLYPPSEFEFTSGAMYSLFEAYGRTDPAKALDLANWMVRQDPTDADWRKIDAFQKNVNDARRLIAGNRVAAARALLARTKPIPYIHATKLELGLANAALANAGGHAVAAYDALLGAMEKEPDDALNAALERYAANIGKSKTDVLYDARRVAARNGTIPYNFTLSTYDGKRVALAGLKGKVVLLNFWYPACGPCRAEFPYVQKLARKFRGSDFVVLAVNVLPDESAYVRPFLQGNAYGFVPLKGTSAWAQQHFNVWGTPQNFLIGADGRIYFKPEIGYDSERAVELEIQQLLAWK